MGFQDALASTASARTSIMPESLDVKDAIFNGFNIAKLIYILYFQKIMPMHLYIWNLTQNSHKYFVYPFIKEMSNILSHLGNTNQNTRQKWPSLTKHLTCHFVKNVDYGENSFTDGGTANLQYGNQCGHFSGIWEFVYLNTQLYHSLAYSHKFLHPITLFL